MEKINEVYEYVWPVNNGLTAVVEKRTRSEMIIIKESSVYLECEKGHTKKEWQFIHDLSVEVLRMYGENKE